MTIQLPLAAPASVSARITLRAPLPSETQQIGGLLSDAFTAFQTSHGFQSDFPSRAEAVDYAAAMLGDPLVYSVVAVKDDAIVGVNFLSEHDPVRGVGPIAVAPDADSNGIGRRLMHHVIERAGHAPGVRLLQDSFNLKSLALYTTLGFRLREPYAVLRGRLVESARPEWSVRPMEPRDLAQVDELSLALTGHRRSGEVRRALSVGTPFVVQRGRILTGYATDLGSWAGGHALTASEDDFRALILGVSALDARPLHFLFPTRRSRVLRWLLSQGMRAEKQMMLMTRGSYQDPEGIYLPSVLY